MHVQRSRFAIQNRIRLDLLAGSGFSFNAAFMTTLIRREHAIKVWKAGVSAVKSESLVANEINADTESLSIGDETFLAIDTNRVIVIGAGKASAGMAAGVERALSGTLWLDRLQGWVNVPDDCVHAMQRIHLHGGRPAGMNEPTEAGAYGTEQILRLVENASENDLCIALISGGGSALLPAPVDGITLRDKLIITKLLSSRGATIEELNAVRGALSKVKAGGLARRSRAGRLITLIISDVIGDPLPVIASGPTIIDEINTRDPRETLLTFAHPDEIPANVLAVLENWSSDRESDSVRTTKVSNRIIGSNSIALKAACDQAEALGYRVISKGSQNAGIACDEGIQLASDCRKIQADMSEDDQPVCILSGGEPTVELIPTDKPRKGGRNQELALSALNQFGRKQMIGITILSAGTDGEDGPTNAAGGIVDDNVQQKAIEMELPIQEFLAINNTYPFLAATDGLLITGPTHTNVMDLRVALVEYSE